MRILITGNMGYLGPRVTARLRRAFPTAELTGLDMGYFAHCLTNAALLPECRLHRQLYMDVRAVPEAILADVDLIVHLAAVSNDPMGNAFEKPTLAINAEATEALARAAKRMGVGRFVYASSCSMYGAADDGPRDESSPQHPLTAYARSKVRSEAILSELADERFVATSLRFSTACGMSERLRLDLVLNDFVAAAVTSGRITILSDGSPWRPLIHVEDMARAIEWACAREARNGGAFLAVNVGSNKWNYQIKDLAFAVADVMTGTAVSINTQAQPDKRSYQVNFDRFAALAPDHQPRYDLERTVRELRAGLEEMCFNVPKFRESWYMRLKVLKDHVAAGRLDEHLTWRF